MVYISSATNYVGRVTVASPSFSLSGFDLKYNLLNLPAAR